MTQTRTDSPVIILGMHRSGTSCLAGCLQELGLFLGDVITSAPHNAKGNRENARLMQLHEEVFESNGGSWDRPPQSPVWSESQSAMLAAILEDYPQEVLWGFKDPRTVFLLEHWLNLYPDARFIASFRHPVPVAMSLAMRNGFSLDQGIRLWAKYNLEIIRFAQENPFPILDFDLPPDRYTQSVMQSAVRMGIPLTSLELNFLDTRLKHQAVPELVVLHREIAVIYERLRSLSALNNPALEPSDQEGF